ncbi:MAG: hypothetical protein K9J06_02435 [Flavobacteriales bacterium]|nr:hypothetical protein [Flavobacteriales bacterium]
MRNALPIAFILSLGALTAQAQIDVASSTTESADAQTTFFVDIPQNTLKTTEKPWHRYVGKGSKGKSSVNNGTHLQLGAVNKNISPEPFDIHSTLTETIGSVRLTAWLTRDGKAFISKESVAGQEPAVEKYLHDFAIGQYRDAVKDELKCETGKLKGMEKSLAKIIKEGERSVRTVRRNDRSSERTNAAMTTSEQDIATKSERIEGQRDMVDATASDPNASKGAEKTMDGLKDDKKDLQKLNESQGRDLDDLNKDSRKAQRNIIASDDRMTEMQAQIAVQRTVVANVQAKLESIR